jgi:hypothetical protein
VSLLEEFKVGETLHVITFDTRGVFFFFFGPKCVHHTMEIPMMKLIMKWCKGGIFFSCILTIEVHVTTPTRNNMLEELNVNVDFNGSKDVHEYTIVLDYFHIGDMLEF